MERLMLRDERVGRNERYLWAFVDERGLHIDGHDLGPGTSGVSGDGEYEWSRVFAPAEVPKVLELLDGEPGEDALGVLRRWVGRADELEERIRGSLITHQFSSYGG